MNLFVITKQGWVIDNLILENLVQIIIIYLLYILIIIIYLFYNIFIINNNIFITPIIPVFVS